MVFWLAASAHALPAPRDTIPPTGKWIAPKAYSVISTNQVRVAVEAADSGGSGVDRVVFYASYWDNTSHFRKRDSIGQAVKFPYEIIWDCTEVPDQAYTKLRFFAKILDRAGNVQQWLGTPDPIIPPVRGHDIWRTREGKILQEWKEDTSLAAYPWDCFVLDRNPAYKTNCLRSFEGGGVTVDGSLEDWRPRDSIRFNNNDNQVTVYSARDRERLYFGIRVLDGSVVNLCNAAGDSSDGDMVELFLDLDHRRQEIMDRRDQQFTFAPCGTYWVNTIDTLDWHVVVRPDIQYAVRLQGTLNRESDRDTGYTMEIGLPWGVLGRNPGGSDSLGLDIFNTDQDFIQGTRYFSSWSNLKMTSLCNPSEWGSLALVRERRGLPGLLLLALGGAAVAATAGFIRYRIKARRINEALSQVPVKEQIQKAKDLIAANFAQEDLNRETVAERVCLNPAYFGVLFKKETGKVFNDYLNDFRVRQAENLLKTTKIDITQIAYKVGFRSLSSFNKIFKKIHSASPRQFRESQIGRN